MEQDDVDLIEDARRGNALAFEQLVQRYDKQVLSIALSYTGNAEDARDIYQEVFIRVFRALGKFRFESKFSTWLHRITTNVCLTHRSQSKTHLMKSIDEEIEHEDGTQKFVAEELIDHQTPARATLDSEISSEVAKALQTLSPQQRLVFTLRHYEGHKLREIAVMLNCAEGTVKKYLFTATEKLREQLQDRLR